MAKAFREVMWLLAVLLAAPTIISLIQKTFQIGLAPYFTDFVELYLRLVRPVLEVLYWPLEHLFDWLGLA